MKARIIAIEGLDCSFKETNAKRLKEELESMGYKVMLQSFPAYGTKSAYFVEEFLAGHYMSDKVLGMSSHAINLFYALDRFDTFNKYLREFYLNEENEKRVIIFDRWVKSNYYQAATAVTDRTQLEMMLFVNQLEYNSLKLPIEDVLIYMDTPYELSKKVRAEKAGKDINETNEALMERVYNFYGNLFKESFKEYENVFTISCGTEEAFYDRDTIFNSIKEKVIPFVEKLFEEVEEDESIQTEETKEEVSEGNN